MINFSIEFEIESKQYIANVQKIPRVRDMSVQFHVFNLPAELGVSDALIDVHDLEKDIFTFPLLGTTSITHDIFRAIRTHCHEHDIPMTS